MDWLQWARTAGSASWLSTTEREKRSFCDTLVASEADWPFLLIFAPR